MFFKASSTPTKAARANEELQKKSCLPHYVKVLFLKNAYPELGGMCVCACATLFSPPPPATRGRVCSGAAEEARVRVVYKAAAQKERDRERAHSLSLLAHALMMMYDDDGGGCSNGCRETRVRSTRVGGN